MKTFYKRTWAEIDLDALHFNLKQIRGALGAETEVMAVVKADAYGHGDRMIAQTLEQSGVSAFAVSNINEAISLRRHGVHGKLLILGYTPPEAASRSCRLPHFADRLFLRIRPPAKCRLRSRRCDGELPHQAGYRYVPHRLLHIGCRNCCQRNCRRLYAVKSELLRTVFPLFKRRHA